MQNQSEKRTLLLADDSVTIQKVVNLTFADEGIDVTSVGDGNSALDIIRNETPDIVLADVNMPGLDGYEICARVKDDENTAELPVVLLVGSFEPFDEDEAERVKADGYLTKPFQSISQLVEKVHNLLDGEAEITEGEESAGESSEVQSPTAPEAATVSGVEQPPVESTPVPQISFPNPFEGNLELPDFSEPKARSGF